MSEPCIALIRLVGMKAMRAIRIYQKEVSYKKRRAKLNRAVKVNRWILIMMMTDLDNSIDRFLLQEQIQ